MRRAWLLPIVLCCSLVTLVAGCGSSDPTASGGSTVDVVAGFYPLEFIAANVGGEDATVDGLTKPGAEPHDLELTPRQVAAVRSAKLVVLIRHLAPAVDDAVKGHADNVLDLADVQPLTEGFAAIEGGAASKERTDDPHVWLDPVRMQALVNAVADRMSQLDSAHRDGYVRRAAALVTQLKALDAAFRTGLAACARHEIVTSHNAFGYLARRYGLTQVGILGLTPDEEPRPAHLATVARYARDHHVTTIFFESLVSPKVARTVAAEIGAKTAVLDPVESQPSTGDYFSAMRTNLTTLRTALGCQ